MLPCADGTNRACATTGERMYAEALRELGTVRPLIGRAVDDERQAREALQKGLRELGPVHPVVHEAFEKWRRARAARRTAEMVVEEAAFRLELAIGAWAREAAGAWRAA